MRVGDEARGRSGTTSEWLYVPWLALSTWCVFLMWAWPGGEVVPFHAIWISFALLYGFEPWPLRRTAITLGAFAVATGAILVQRAVTGVIAGEEIAEIPLMWTLALLVVWHVQRRQEALDTVTRIARRDVAAARHRERLARLSSHEMRTPLTIASGYVDLLVAEEPDPARRADLDVVRDELGRLSRAGDRLVRMIALQERLPSTRVDVDALAAETGQRWSAVAPRTWAVDTRCGSLEASAERLRDCLDTLIENAVRYTPEGGTVRLLGHRRGGAICLGVADSGPGLGPGLAAAINAAATTTGVAAETLARTDAAAQGEGQDAPGGAWFGVTDPLADPTPSDPRSQTGMGLTIVQETLAARGGRLLAGRAREGGALLLMVLPLHASCGDVGPAPARPVRTRSGSGSPSVSPAGG